MKLKVTRIGLMIMVICVLNLQKKRVKTAVYANAEHTIYLPTVIKPEIIIPEGTNRLENGSFEEGWTDMPPAQEILINQQPIGWTLSWVEPGDPLFDDPGITAEGVPESVHKHTNQLPPNEQPGGPDALILDGDWVYKTFHYGSPFGTELKQTVTDLPAGDEMRITAPIQLHLQGGTGPYSASSSLWVNNIGSWAYSIDMGDRQWCKHERLATVPSNGELEVIVRVKSKWPTSKDFFIDDIYMLPSHEPSPYPTMPLCTTN